ncbi:hypothetical protein A3K81_03220 [Candidatus Bathyarchaeota archaeon RBG_13_60_20]|nr:MAG: hypothetical protein A3K81_03220 [Candidatus Bathyarchaeota archaeon RBG_13_60_20]
MRGRSLLEVAAVFALLEALRLAPGVAELQRWETRALGASYFAGILMVAVPVVAVVVSKGSLEDYGLPVRSWARSLSRGLAGYMWLLAPNLVLFFAGVYGLGVASMPVSLLVSGVTLLALFMVLRRLASPGPPRPRRDLALLVLLAASPLAVSALAGSLSLRLVSTLVWELVFGGAAEEILYRGYVQGRVNEEFGRPWRLMGVCFGPGLLVSSAIFGVAGALGTATRMGLGGLSLAVGVHGAALGLFYGFMREATGDVGASSVANGLNEAVGRLLLRAVS